MLPEMEKEVALVRAVLEDTKAAYAQLLTLMERRLRMEPDLEEEQTQLFDQELSTWMERADKEMALLQQRTQPWEEKKRNFPADLREEVDRFFEMLKTGMEGMEKQIQHRREEVEKLREVTRHSLRQLQEKKKGYGGYRSPGKGPRFFDKKA